MENITIVGSGPSATNYSFGDDEFIMVVNESYKLPHIPQPKIWFTLDPNPLTIEIARNKLAGEECRYFMAVDPQFGFIGAKDPRNRVERPAGVNYLLRCRDDNNYLSMKYGLSENKRYINTGNSMYGALGLAYHIKPRQITLVGLDGGNREKFDGKQCSGKIDHLPQLFESAKVQLIRAGIKVYNANPNSTVRCFDFLNMAEE